MPESTPRPVCCTNVRALLFCAGLFILVYGAFLLAAAWWPALQAHQLPALLAAIGVACLGNFSRNRTLHCAVTGPLCLIAAVTLLVDTDAARLVLPLVLVGTGIAFLLELLQLHRAARG